MSDVVVFPGSTDHIETEDVNLLDADTAHMIQSQPWTGTTADIVDLGPQSDGFGAITVTRTSTAGAQVRQTSLPSIPVSGDYVVSVEIDNPSGATQNFRFQIITNEDGPYVGLNFVDLENTKQWYSVALPTVTTPANAVELWLAYRTETMVGVEFTMRHWMLEAGTSLSTEFAPSLRIVGTLGETINPVDMPIAYAADGTPLTVGEGWAGEGVEYTRYDGDVGVGPIVAQFLASDLP